MNGERFYNLCFTALRLLHWVAFFAVVETMFWFAGLLLFGLLGTFFGWIWFRLTGQNNAKILRLVGWRSHHALRRRQMRETLKLPLSYLRVLALYHAPK